jgi:long-chain acyl-CoA synthetase
MSSLQQIILERAASTPDKRYLVQAMEGRQREWTWGQALAEARAMALALEGMGLEPGDRVALISRNCAHWILADMAMILSGLVSVPIYPTANAATIRAILEHSEAAVCFVGKIEDPPERQLAGIPDSVRTIAFPYPGAAGDHAWDDLVAANGGEHELRPRGEEDLATLLYTSGSTGEPKGAMHSHHNFNWVGQTIAEAMGVRPDDRVFSYLPLSHCTERAYVEAVSFHAGTSLFFAESIETFQADLLAAQPTLFGSVPRLWKKFQLGVLAKVPQKKLDRLLAIPILSGFIRRKIKRGLGLDQARWFGSGSAPIAVSLLEWWDRLGVPIREGWGMTETFAYGTQIGTEPAPRFGTISRALPGAELKIGDDQELLIRCPCLMSGYYKAEALNEEVFVDGFFRTGDRAFIDDDGWVRITGRTKELFKTTKGKYIAPVPIESLLARNAHIELACVVGSGLPQPLAFVQLAETASSDRDGLSAELAATLHSLNTELEPHQRLSQLIVTAETWEVDNGLLTPTLKLKRDALEARFGRLIGTSSQAVLFEDA